jgi:hypothetical protein
LRQLVGCLAGLNGCLNFVEWVEWVPSLSRQSVLRNAHFVTWRIADEKPTVITDQQDLPAPFDYTVWVNVPRQQLSLSGGKLDATGRQRPWFNKETDVE